MPAPMLPSDLTIQVFPDLASTAQAAAGIFQDSARRAMRARRKFFVMLSGGSTPKMIYATLAAARRIDWGKVHFFWGDERCVSPEHSESNFRMAHESLFLHLDRPLNIHRMRGEILPWDAAADYEAEIRAAFGIAQDVADDPPAFDLVLLGMGEDGHTASLFPGSSALQETTRWVTWVEHAHPPPPLLPRLTVTLPLINAARQVVFVVTGESKSQRVAQILGPHSDQDLPAAQVRPRPGKLIWLLDQAAAQHLQL